MGQRTVLFTGGGSAGHVIPCIPLIQALQRDGCSIHYIGTENGIERAIMAEQPDVCFHSISAGKLRRYFSLKNVSDLFRVLRGIGQAAKVIKKVRPDVVFSKGGYVSVPAVLAARNRCRIISHESDYSPGLSTRIANRYADTVCCTFADTAEKLGSKGLFTGTPIRPELYAGDAARGFAVTGLQPGKPVLLAMGGSLGAAVINDCLQKSLDVLLQTFQIVHLTGKGKRMPDCARPGYVQYEYVDAALPDLFAMADILLSRAGANAIFEFLALKKPALLIPLPLSASRGDQMQNAKYFIRRGYARMLAQETLTPERLMQELSSLYAQRGAYTQAMDQEKNIDGTSSVLQVIQTALRGPGRQNKTT